MARPKKTTENKRTHRLPHVRCTESEFVQAQARAEKAGIGLSEFSRQMILEGTVVVNDNQVPFDFALVNELNRIGVNLNQLTRLAHATGEMPSGLQSVWTKLDKVLNTIIDQTDIA